MMTSTIEDDGELNDIWVVYFHDPNDKDWNTSSYVNMGSITSIKEYWQHHLSFIQNVNQGMFFVMREYVFPMWDDKENINGGCLSIKVLKDNIANFWEDLTMKLLGESLLKEKYRDKWNMINGISTSPKKHFCIIKIWLKDESLYNKDFFELQSSYGDVIYKSNRENISNDNVKK
jgi:hypothetical protein